MVTVVRAMALSAGLLALGACATITRGQHTAMEFKTSPPGAKVETTNNMSCDSTPCSLTMARNAEFDATISKPGYKTLKVHVTHRISSGGGAGMAGNVLVGGLIGAGVDAASGAMFDLTPNPVDVALEKDDPPFTAVSAPTNAAAPPPPAAPVEKTSEAAPSPKPTE